MSIARGKKKQSKTLWIVLLEVVRLIDPFVFVRSNILWSSVRKLPGVEAAGIVKWE